ncbi:MAG: alpha/beta hydrolase [Alphaproteobacteria bacterium]
MRLHHRGGRRFIISVLPRIKARTLVVTTEGSQLQPVEAVRAYQQQIPNSRLLVLPGDSYHVAAAKPDECSRIALEFLASLGAATAKPASPARKPTRPMLKTRLPDGGHLAYDEYNFTDPWSKPDTIVLVHGFSKNRLYWYEWIPALARHYRVLNVDQRGHGDLSLPPRDFTMSLRPFADDLVSFLDAVGLQGAHFIMADSRRRSQSSLGPPIPDRVKSMVLPGFGYARKSGRDGLGRMAAMAENEDKLLGARDEQVPPADRS